MGTQVLVDKMVLIVKYVDDNIICEKVNFGNVPIVTINGRKTKERRADGVQNAFIYITTRALAKGMSVNADKTNLLCISNSLNFLPKEQNNVRISCTK